MNIIELNYYDNPNLFKSYKLPLLSLSSKSSCKLLNKFLFSYNLFNCFFYNKITPINDNLFLDFYFIFQDMDNTEFDNLPQHQSTPYSPPKPTQTSTHKIQNIFKGTYNHHNNNNIKNMKNGNNISTELKDKKQFSSISPFSDQKSNQYNNTIPGFENENDDFDSEKFLWSRNLQNGYIGR